MIIEKDCVVEIEYALYNEKGEELSREPLTYIHGHEELIPGFERALEGAEAGQEVSFSVEPDEAYGAFDEELVIKVPRDAFPEGTEIELGWVATAHDAEGNEYPHTVIELTDDEVTLDGNHPLAGEILHYDVKVISVREATDHEREHGVLFHREEECCDHEH